MEQQSALRARLLVHPCASASEREGWGRKGRPRWFHPREAPHPRLSTTPLGTGVPRSTDL